MNILALDTSTEFASVALSFHGELWVEEQDNIRQHAQFLLPMIERLLQQSGTTLDKLDGIAFGCGPGSFTGLRIACAVAKGLGFAHDLPLFPVSTLKTIAYEVYEQGHTAPFEVLTLLDARMQQLYWAHFKTKMDDAIERVSNSVDVVFDQHSPIIIAGVGYESYLQQLPERVQSAIALQCKIFPHARTMIQMVQSGHCQARSAIDALPVYIRDDVAAVSKASS